MSSQTDRHPPGDVRKAKMDFAVENTVWITGQIPPQDFNIKSN
jgi:hypothetical protein